MLGEANIGSASASAQNIPASELTDRELAYRGWGALQRLLLTRRKVEYDVGSNPKGVRHGGMARLER
jgi:hypothetical protein